MKIFWNKRTAVFPFNNKGEVNPPIPPTPPVIPPPVNDIPKTKEEWDRLSAENPTRWIQLTQPRMDQAIRESREWKEKASMLDNKAKNLELELNNFRRSSQPPASQNPPFTPSQPGTFDTNKPASRENMPQTNEEWDRLFVEDPRLATDLRVEQATQKRATQEQEARIQQEVFTSQQKCREELWDRHPDMFVLEVEADGITPKKDGNGKLVLKVDPNTGGRIVNFEHEKGKLFAEVYNEDRFAYDSAKTGPRLAMLEMERRLVAKGNQHVAANQSQLPAGQGGPAVGDQRGTLPGGVPPPATLKVSFASDEEKTHAERAVQRGIYKDLGHYCSLRDAKNTGIVEQNRVPQFGPK